MASQDGFSYLMPTHTEKHRRAPNWTDGEMKALLFVWEEFHNELKVSKRNAKVYEKMSQRFFQLTGDQRFKEEIKMKITNMSFQFRRLKATVAEGGETPDWPYYAAIEKIIAKPLENGRVSLVDFKPSGAGPSTSSQSTENQLSQSEEGMMGFLPEYTGSSDEMEIKEEIDSLSSESEQTQGSSSHAVPTKRKRHMRELSMKRKKLRLMQSMLQQQRRVSRAMEETCREVRLAMHQQNLVQVQCLQLQERMMNLLEKMIQPPAAVSCGQSGVKD